MDDSTKTTVISASDALKSLEIVQTFLIQQENTKEQVKMANIFERYIRERKAKYDAADKHRSVFYAM